MKHTDLLSLPTSPEHAARMASLLIEYHRGTFGGLRMGPPEGQAEAGKEGDGKGDQSGGDGKGGDDKGKEGTGPKVNENGYPDAVPVTDMQPEQQTAYWKHKARKWETNAKAREDYDAQKSDADKWRQAQRENLPADQRAIEDARRDADQAARADERSKSGKRLVQAELRGALRGRVKDDQIGAMIGPLDHTYFLTGDGEVDADKVSVYAGGFGQSGAQWPDMGQGNRGHGGSAKGVDAGRDLYNSRHKKTE